MDTIGYTGAAPRGGLGGTVPPTPHKGHFVSRLKPLRKYWGYEGG